MTIGLLLLTVLVIIAIAAPRYGADTRTDDSWTTGRGEPRMPPPPPRLLDDIRRLTAAVRSRL